MAKARDMDSYLTYMFEKMNGFRVLIIFFGGEGWLEVIGGGGWGEIW